MFDMLNRVALSLRRLIALQEERIWQINPCDIIFSNPEEVLGSGAHGIIVKARYVLKRLRTEKVRPAQNWPAQYALCFEFSYLHYRLRFWLAPIPFRYRGTPVAVKRLRESLQRSRSDSTLVSDNDVTRQLRPTLVYSSASSRSLASSASGQNAPYTSQGLSISQGTGSMFGLGSGSKRSSRAWSQYIRSLPLQ
jgi:hypothetical protein